MVILRNLSWRVNDHAEHVTEVRRTDFIGDEVSDSLWGIGYETNRIINIITKNRYAEKRNNSRGFMDTYKKLANATGNNARIYAIKQKHHETFTVTNTANEQAL